MGLNQDYQPDDPLIITAAQVPGGDPETQARVMIDEFLQLGTSPEELMGMFNNPFYAGINLLTAQLGSDRIAALIAAAYRNQPSVTLTLKATI